MDELDFSVSKPTIIDRVIGYFHIFRFIYHFRKVEIKPNGRYRSITSQITID